MAWTKTQKQLAVRACREAGICDEQRTDVLLRSFGHAHYGGDITSTSPRLTNHDFEAFMAIVERHAGGRILHFTEGYWQHAADDHLQRMRHRVRRVAHILEDAGRLVPDGVGLAGWISKRVTKGEHGDIAQLDYHGMLALILGLEAYARQNGIALDTDAEASIGRSPQCTP